MKDSVDCCAYAVVRLVHDRESGGEGVCIADWDAANPGDVLRDVDRDRGDNRRDNACGGGPARGRGGGGGGVAARRRGGHKGRLYYRAAALARGPLRAFRDDDDVVRKAA